MTTKKDKEKTKRLEKAINSVLPDIFADIEKELNNKKR